VKVKGSNPHIRRKIVIYNYILVAKDKLHKTLVANVDEVNIKQNHNPYTIVLYHSYITVKIVTHGIIPICHLTFLNFGQNKLKSIFRWVGRWD